MTTDRMLARQAARERARRRRLRRRRRTFTVATLLLVVIVVLVARSLGSSSTPSKQPASDPASAAGSSAASNAASAPKGPAPIPSIEAGVESWALPSVISRSSVVAQGSNLLVAGGLTPAGTSTPTVQSIDPATGSVTTAGSLADGTHDAAAATIGGQLWVFGGGNPNTFATIQRFASGGSGAVAGSLPQPRSDLAAATVTTGGGSTTYLLGGYTGSQYLSQVLATTDGTHFRTVANLPVPVRYAATAAFGGRIYLFGGETFSSNGSTTVTDDIQEVDPAADSARIVGHLHNAFYGAAAFPIGRALYLAGGQIPGGPTLTGITAYVPSSGKLLQAGLLPQAVAFGGYTTVGSGSSAIGYIVGGEVTSQTGRNAAGVASGQLSTVISLRPSPYGGPAGTTAAGMPYRGTLLIADRGNDRLIAITPTRRRIWVYPSPSMPTPNGGFYFPDDAFFIRHGTAIISNQENNDTIVEIGYPSGKILWEYGHPKVPGSLPGYLFQPDDAYLERSGIVTVADASNNRILFINPTAKTVVGQIGNGTDAHVPGVSIAYPNGDTPLANGDVLVSEINGSYVDEYTPTGKMVWSVQMKSVNYPSDPQQLGPDRYLMTDYDPPAEGRILEFNRAGQILWRYDATSGDGRLDQPSLAERLPNGLIMVNDDYNDRVIAIDPRTNSIVWQYGLTHTPGTAPGMLSVPDGFDLLLANGTTPTHPQTG